MASQPVRPGARTPEELETLLEDGVMLGDHKGLTALLEDAAVLVVTNAPPARGQGAIRRLVLATWDEARPYLAACQRIVQTRDIVLIVTEHGTNVARCDRDGTWRYVILTQAVESAPQRSKP